MAEIVNLRRARKARSRAEAAAQAGANRVKHGVTRNERALARTQAENLKHTTDAHRLEDRDR